MLSRNDPLPGISGGETLRDDPSDGCVGDYASLHLLKSPSRIEAIVATTIAGIDFHSISTITAII